MNELLQHARRLLKSGRWDHAVAILDDVISQDPGHGPALQLRAQAAHQGGRLDEAVAFLRRAAQSSPDSWAVHNNLGNVLSELGRTDEAVAALRKAGKLAPREAMVAFNLANTLSTSGRLEEAVDSYRRAVEMEPKRAPAWRGLGIALNGLDRAREAADAYRRVVELRPDDPTALNDLGAILLQLGELQEAQPLFARACRLAPRSAEPFCNLGIVLLRSADYAGALRAFDEALRLDPAMARAAAFRARTLMDRGDTREALTALDEAVGRTPGNMELRLVHAEVLEQLHRVEAARKAIGWLLANAGDHAEVRALAARVERREGKLDQALAILEESEPTEGRNEDLARWHAEYGQVLNALDRHDQAFEQFRLANERFARDPAFANLNSSTYWKWLRRIREATTPAWVGSLPQLESGTRSVVFVVGFPRSGTTLVERILDAHPALAVLGEQPPLQLTLDRVKSGGADYPRDLPNLSKSQLRDLRRFYDEQAARCIDLSSDQVLVDKNPLSLVHTPFIMQLFPGARFVFVERHPCDAVLSGFMQAFDANEAMASFLTLEDAAHLYEELLLLWQQYRELLGPPVIDVRYETLVEDFETPVRQLLEFVGVAWDEAVRGFDRHARESGRIRTPSYSQVTQPIYTTSRQRWRNYATQLQPALDILAPHIKRLGY